MKSVGFKVGPGQRQLFLDDVGIARMENLTRTMHRPEKRGVVLKVDQPSDGKGVHTASAPMWIEDKKVYKLVYEVRSGEEKRYALAISADGLQWEKPELGLVDFQGSKKNNLFETPDKKRVWHVVYDPDDTDESRRYKGLLTVPKGRIPVVSPDCTHWRKLEFDPLNLRSGDAGTMTYDRPQRRFLALLKRPGAIANPAAVGRAYDVAVSEDFENWSEPRFIFGMDTGRDQEMALDIIRRRLANPALAKPMYVDPDPAVGWTPPEGKNHIATWQAECYNFGVFPYEGVYLGLATVFYPTGQNLPERVNTDGFNTIQLTASRDLDHWERLGDRQPFLETSRLDEGLVGNYDRLQLGFFNQGVVHGDEVRFYYNGMKRRASFSAHFTDGSPRDPSTLSDAERADWLDDSDCALHLAVLRRDGFVSLDAGEEEGVVQTQPFTLQGNKLLVNAELGEGELRVEMIDGEGKVLATSAPLQGDLLNGEVRWQKGNPGELKGQMVSLRFALRNGAFFSYWLED